MSETYRDKHNRLVADFVQKAGGETNSAAEMMVIIESAIFATMLILIRVYATRPAHASALLEAALHRATERLAEASK